MREAYALALEDDNSVVHLAASGLEGLELARQNRPDLVFLDLNMPGMDGVQTLRALSQIYSDLYIYIVTAFATEYMASLIAAKSEGMAFEIATKPLSIEQIQMITKAIL